MTINLILFIKMRRNVQYSVPVFGDEGLTGNKTAEPILHIVTPVPLFSLSGNASYRKISWNLEAARFGFIIFIRFKFDRLLRNRAADKPTKFQNNTVIVISNFEALNFTRFCCKTSWRLVNRGPDSYSPSILPGYPVNTRSGTYFHEKCSLKSRYHVC